MTENNNNSRPFISPIYQIYSELGEIDPYSVETEEQEIFTINHYYMGVKTVI